MTRRLTVTTILLLFEVLALMVSSASASTITISTVQEGWWDSTGSHTGANLNYGAGDDASGTDHHDFFVFSLSGVTGTITSATLRIFNPNGGYSSPDLSETLGFFDVSTSIAALLATGAGQVAIYNDLGTGVSYGSRSVSAADNNTFVSQSLNASAIAAIQSALGGSFAVGGALTTLNQPANVEGIFLFSNGQANQLVLEVTDVVPEPTSVILLATGLIACAQRRIRRQAARKFPTIG
jgi:hypothetical protein